MTVGSLYLNLTQTSSFSHSSRFNRGIMMTVGSLELNLTQTSSLRLTIFTRETCEEFEQKILRTCEEPTKVKRVKQAAQHVRGL